jgi:hypothetical protein
MGPHCRARLAQRRRGRCLRTGHGTNLSGARPSCAAFGLGRVPTPEQRAVHESGGALGRVVSASARAIAVAVSRVRLALCCPMICRVSGAHVPATTPQPDRAAARHASIGPKMRKLARDHRRDGRVCMTRASFQKLARPGRDGSRTSVRTGKAPALTHLSRRVDDFSSLRVVARMRQCSARSIKSKLIGYDQKTYLGAWALEIIASLSASFAAVCDAHAQRSGTRLWRTWSAP